jgi:hypothetical protein
MSTARFLGSLLADYAEGLIPGELGSKATGETNSARAVRHHLADTPRAAQTIAQVVGELKIPLATVTIALKALVGFGFAESAPLRLPGTTRYANGFRLTLDGLAQSAKDHPSEEQRAILDEDLLQGVKP